MAEALKWILVAEDDEDFLELLTTKMELALGSGVKIITASNGLEASGRLPYQAFDCIVTDLKMPVKEGQALIKTVTQSALNAKTPIVVITGEPDKSLEKKHSHLKLFEKPADLDEVIKHVESQIKLGPTDQRLTAGLLNAFINGVQEFIGKALEIDAKLEMPGLKEKGIGFEGEVFRVYDIRSGKSKARFIVGYEKELLRKLAIKFNADTENFKKLTEAAGKVIYNRIMKKGVAPGASFSDQAYFEDPNHTGYSIEIGQRGIKMPVTCDAGTITIFVFW
jgi:CheY-like chemotaxis protein